MTRSPGYDLFVERDSDAFGLMLVDDKSKGLLYRDSHAPTVNPNVSPTEADYTAFPTYIDWPIAQTTFHGEFGKLIHDKKYPVRYGEGVGWDPRKENELKLFPSETSETVNLRVLATASFANMDFETAYGSSWVKTENTSTDGFDVDRSSVSKKAGTYSWNLAAYKIDDFSSDNFTDVGTRIVVDAATNHRLNFNSVSDATDDHCYRNFTSLPDNDWKVEFEWRGTNPVCYNAFVYFAVVDAHDNPYLYGTDAVWTRVEGDGHIYRMDIVGVNGGVVGVYSTAITGLANNTSYYARMEKTSATNVTLSLFTDAARTTHVSGSPQSATVSSGITGLTTFQVSNYNDNSTLGPIKGWIDNLKVYGSSVATLRLYQSLSPWGNYYNNKSCTFTCYGATALANNLRIGLSFDGGSTVAAWSDYCGTTNDWTDQMTVTATPPLGATGVMLVIQRESTTYSSADYIDVATFSQSAPRGTPVKIDLKWGTDYYYIENKTLFKWSTNQYLEHFTFEDAIVDVLIYKNRMIVSVGTGDFLYYSGEGTDATWTRSANAGDKVGLMTVIGGTLWGVVADAKVAACTDITSGTWTTGSSIGDSSIVITGIVEYNGTLYVGKQDNVYVLTIASNLSYTTTAIAPRFKGAVSAYNFKHMKVADALILCHNTGVHEWDYQLGGSATLTNISPVLYAPSFTDYHGAAKAVAVGQEWVWLILGPTGSNTKSKVMAMSLKYIANAENPTDYRWHSIAEVDLDEVYDAAELNNKLLICGTKSSTAAVKSFSIYSTSSYPDNNAAGVKCEFRIDNATSWTELNGTGTGSFDSAAGGTIAFQANQSGKRIQFRLSANAGAATILTSYYDGGLPGEIKSFKTVTLSGETFNADGTSATPVIRTFVLRCVLRTPPLRTIWAVVKVEDDIVNHAGISDKIPASTLKTYIDSLFSESDAITLYDIHGNSFTCHVLPDGRGEFDVGYNHDFTKVNSKYELYFQEARTS